MGKHGQNNFIGLRDQSWAAIGLFLQLVRDPNFLRIELESIKSEDFDLIFRNNVIRAESKSWNADISFANVREIIQDFIDKGVIFGEEDEILIICRSVAESAKINIERCKWSLDDSREFFVNRKKFTEAQFELLPKIRFWETDFNNIVFVSQLIFADCFDFWVSEPDLQRMLVTLVHDKIFIGSGLGSQFSRNDFWRLLSDEGLRYQKKSKAFNPAHNEQIDQISNLIDAVENCKSPVWSDDNISAISTQPALMNLIIHKVGTSSKLILKDWEHLWAANIQRAIRSPLFEIFEKNLHDASNISFILTFLEQNLPSYVGTFGWRFIESEVMGLLTKLLSSDVSYFDRIFKLVKLLLNAQNANLFFKSVSDDYRYKIETIACFLLDSFEKVTDSQKQEIYDFVVGHFNLVKDDGEYWEHTPPQIFEIIKKHLLNDISKFENNFIALKKILCKQFCVVYSEMAKNLKFEGWEHSAFGGMISGSEFSYMDRTIVNSCLAPALQNYRIQNSTKALSFVRDHCLIIKVSAEYPDFIRRAAIPFLLEEYKAGNEIAFKALANFLTERQGVHCKRHLIFDGLRKGFSDESQWRLVGVCAAIMRLPCSPFMEEIVSDLAKSGHGGALTLMRSWYEEKEYLQESLLVNSRKVTNIRDVLTFSIFEAKELLQLLINCDHFKNYEREFEVYEVAALLNEFLVLDFAVGKELLSFIWNKQPLTVNQQLLFTSCLLNSKTNKNLSSEYLEEIYIEIVDPFLTLYNNSSPLIQSFIPTAGARASFVRLAETIAKQESVEDRFRKALRILKVFAKDSDPTLPDEKQDNTYNKHAQIERGEETRTIESVRGFCAWSLMYCIKPEGREHIEEVIHLLRNLLNDENYYVQNLAATSLAHIVRCRFHKVSAESEELLLDKDMNRAFVLADDLEEMAISFIEKVSNYPDLVRRCFASHLYQVAGAMKLTTISRAKTLFQLFEKFPEETKGKVAPLYLFFAEIRTFAERDLVQNRPELARHILKQQFDMSHFKILFQEKCRSDNSDITANIAWHLFDLCKSPTEPRGRALLNQTEAIKIALPYFKLLIEKYDSSTFTNIYLFIKECITVAFDDVLELWKSCVQTEIRALNEKLKLVGEDVQWATFASNIEILKEIHEKAGNEEFLNCLELLLDYPKQTRLSGLQKSIEILSLINEPYDKIDALFKKLISRDPNVYEIWEKWKKVISESGIA